jgi:hypothetical protein
MFKAALTHVTRGSAIFIAIGVAVSAVSGKSLETTFTTSGVFDCVLFSLFFAASVGMSFLISQFPKVRQ